LAFVAVCDTVSTADWSPVPQASLIADLLGGNDGFGGAGSTESDLNSRFSQASSALELAFVTVGLSISAAHWLVVKVAGDVADWNSLLYCALSSVGDCNGGLLQTVGSVQRALVAVGLSVDATKWNVIHRTRHHAFVSSSDSCEENEESGGEHDDFCFLLFAEVLLEA